MEDLELERPECRPLMLRSVSIINTEDPDAAVSKGSLHVYIDTLPQRTLLMCQQHSTTKRDRGMKS